MPKCKKCGEKMPKGFSYCGVCGADMVTGLVPWSKTTQTDSNTSKSVPAPKPDTTSKPTSTVINPALKVSMTPSQDIDSFLEDTPMNEPTQKEYIQTASSIAPSQQKFTPATDQISTKTQPVQPKPVQTTPSVAPPQQKFTPATDPIPTKTQPVIQPVQPRPVQATPSVAPPQQKFTPATDSIPTKTQPVIQPVQPRPVQATPSVAPPQQKFTSATDSIPTKTQPVIQPVQPRPVQTTPSVAPSQQKFTPNTQTSRPAYIPKPTDNTPPIEMIRVPDVTNLNQDIARSQLENLGFKVSITTDSSTVVKPNVVMSQNVRVGSSATKGSEIRLVVSVGTWSEWSVDRVVDTNMYVIDQKREFRFRNRTREIETHESSERNLPGYTCIDQRKVYSDWENQGYYTTENIETSETCDISTNLIGFKYCGYSYIGSDLNLDLCYSTKQTALIFNPNTKPEDWEYIETVLYQDIPSQTLDWYPDNDLERSTPAGDTIDCNIKMTFYYVEGKRYAMKYGSLGTEWFLYHTRTEIETVYTYKREYFTDWSEWSDWTNKPIKQDELTEVEARILYRYRRRTSKDLA